MWHGVATDNSIKGGENVGAFSETLRAPIPTMDGDAVILFVDPETDENAIVLRGEAGPTEKINMTEKTGAATMMHRRIICGVENVGHVQCDVDVTLDILFAGE